MKLSEYMTGLLATGQFNAVMDAVDSRNPQEVCRSTDKWIKDCGCEDCNEIRATGGPLANCECPETCEITGDPIEFCACDDCQEARWIDTWIEFDVYRDR